MIYGIGISGTATVIFGGGGEGKIQATGTLPVTISDHLPMGETYTIETSPIYTKKEAAEAPLGINIEKLNIIDSIVADAIQKKAILGLQHNKEVYEVAKDLKKKKNIVVKKFDSLLDDLDKKKINQIVEHNGLASYLATNLSLSVAALKLLAIEYKIENFNNLRAQSNKSQK